MSDDDPGRDAAKNGRRKPRDDDRKTPLEPTDVDDGNAGTGAANKVQDYGSGSTR